MPPPVTPDTARPQSSTDGCFSRSVVPAPASTDFGMFDKHGFISPIGESAPDTGSSPPPQESCSSDKIAPPGEGTGTAAATTGPGAAAPVPTPDKDFGMFDKHGFIYVPSSIGESAPAGAGEPSSSPPQESDSSDKIAPPGEGTGTAAANAPTPGAAATPVHTPYKEEDGHSRPRKKSTKGVPRFKVVKDKRPTPAKVRNTPMTKDPGGESVGVANKLAKRKLDVDAPEVITGSFNRARLLENLIRLAKISDGMKKSKRKTSVEQAIVPYQDATTDAPCSSALVPAGIPAQLAVIRHGNHGKKVRTKLLGLDDETLRVHGVLTKWDAIDTESFEGVDIGSGPEWDGVRQKYKVLVDWFILIVKGLFGSREFSRWGGSVIDSVVGTFLTQNVADNLSSNAFMTLAAKFPMNERKDNAEEYSYEPPSTDDILNGNEVSSDVNDSINSIFPKPVDCEKVGCTEEVKGQYGQDYKTIMENFLAIIQEKDVSTWEKDDLLNLVKDKSGKPICSERTLRKFIATLRLEDTAHWDNLRDEACKKGYDNKSKTRVSDKVEWEAVQKASLVDVAKCIAGRGQHYLLALRIQAFLTRIKKDHGSFDLDWLKHVPRESAKEYLLSINGLGAKSVDCIRLLSLEHKAFPVDVNVARIVTRLEWVELQCCDEEFHLVDLYPLMEDVQSYLWPRLCTIDKEKLYELHCLMITFGKVICTKVDPNCNACPFRSGCRWYRSKLTRPLLPPAEDHVREHGKGQVSMITSERLLLSNGSCTPSQQVCQLEIDESRTAGRQPTHSCEPIIEVPPSPEYEYEALDEQGHPYEDDLVDIEDIMSEGVQYDVEINLCSNKPMASNGSWTPNCGKGLALSDSRYTSRKLKNIGHLRTEHHAYVLPDEHVILEEFEDRVPDDPCHYLLVVTPCPDDNMVKGTILIPCRTASRGNFPLNGTYFQDHEVFADHASSHFPITIPRDCIWNLERRTVYFGSSIHSITKGQPRQDIEDCFKRGHVCVRGFDRVTRYPRRLCATLHSLAGEKKEGGEQREGAWEERREGTSSK